jgi:hypothetical protein
MTAVAVHAPAGEIVKQISAPTGTAWMKTSTVPPSMWSAPWSMAMPTRAGAQSVRYPFRTVVDGGRTYLQIYTDRYLNFIASKFTMTIGSPSGIGAVTDTALQAATGALLQSLKTNGCQTTSDPTVATFQNAWNAAGAGTALAVDGLYGPNTQAAFQSALDAGVNQPPETAPAECVLPTTVVTGSATAVTTLPGAVSPKSYTIPILVGVGLLGAGIVGYAVYKKQHRKA